MRTAGELAEVLQTLYGSVCYVGIDIDPELKYPKVRFSIVGRAFSSMMLVKRARIQLHL